MANTKEYKIVINGVSESINAVEALNKQLDALEERIKALEKNNIKVNTSSNGGGSNTSAIKEEIAAQKELNKLKKEEAAQQRLIAGEYDNTMKGMKQNLADIKTVINATDLGETDSIKNMAKDAKELNDKLLEIEKSYGQFGRQVGNYKIAADGFKALAIQVGDTTREFDNAKQAMKELKKERDTLAVKKEMGLISEDEAKRLEELIPTVAQLQSAIQDAGKPMDALMDSMQSVVALAQTGKGFAAFFGIDDDEIERSIQKLVALQNAMQGLQTLQKQMQSQEGIGQWLAKGNGAIDKLVSSIFGVEKASKGATVAAKALGTALKAIGIGAIVAGVTLLIGMVEQWADKQKKAAEEAEEAAEKVRKAVDDQRQAYINASAQYMNTASRLSYLRTEYKKSNDELRKTNIIKEAAAEFKKLGISVNSVNDAQRIFVNDGDKVIQLLKLQGDAAAVAALRMEAFKKSFQMLMENGYDANSASILAGYNKDVLALDERLNQINDQASKLKQTLKIEDDFIKKSKELGNKRAKEAEESQRTINQLELRLMRDGLNKKMMQLDEEERQTINKLQENGRKTAAEIKKIQELYKKLKIKEVKEVLKTLEENVQQSTDDIKNMEFDLNIGNIELKVKEVNDVLESLEENVPRITQLLSNTDVENIMNGVSMDAVLDAKDYIDALNLFHKTSNNKEIKEFLDDFYSTFNDEQKKYLQAYENEWGKGSKYDGLAAMYEEQYKEALDIVRTYGESITNLIEEEEEEENETNLIEEENKTNTLAKSFANRLIETRKFYNDIGTAENVFYGQRKKLLEESLNNEIEKQKLAEDTRYGNQKKSIDKQLSAATEALSAITDINSEEYKEAKKLYDEAYANSEKARKQHEDKLTLIGEQGEAERKEIEKKAKEDTKALASNYFEDQLTNYRAFQSKLNDEVSKQPVADKTFGIVNIKQTKKNYNDILEASKKTLDSIKEDKIKLDFLYSQGFIDPKAYNDTKQQLIDLENDAKHTQETVGQSSKNLTSDFIGSINQYVQYIGQAITSVLNAVWSAQDAAYEREKDRLQEQLDFVQDKYDKMAELAEQYADRMKEIEGIISTVQGDARDALLDRYNAELQAERKAIMEKQKAAKEEEKLKKKEEALEKKRRQQEYERNVIQAFVSWHLGVANALAVPPFPVGMAMAAIATVLGGIQYAFVKSQKPYAKGGQLEGGVAQGKRHSEGGIPVLGGRASIEGGEFITNRQTTANNIDLLDYINSKHRKLNIDDFIDFYSSGKAKKNFLASSPRQKFADGGVIPTLSSDYQIDDRIVGALEKYSERPYYVTVTDIEDRMNEVKYVRTLAGVEQQ